MESWGQPKYRAQQVTAWLYGRRAVSWEEMTNVPATLRSRLADHFALGNLELARKQGSRDATQKFLWRLQDQALIETVLIPANPALYGEASDRHTLCVSTQVGCAYGCRFCASGLDGWKRNLGPEEILGQVLEVERFCGSEAVEENQAGTGTGAESRHVSNLVIMGMGEPLANYTNLLTSSCHRECPLGDRHRRSKDHDLHKRSGAGNSPTGRRTLSVSIGCLASRRHRRCSRQDHACQSQVSSERPRRRLRIL